MSLSTFPIVEVKGHRAISIDGNVGSFYKMLPPDLEQMCPIQLNNYYERISKSLNNFSDDSYFKFYSINGEFYLESNSKTSPTLSNVDISPKKDPLKVFFGDNQLFSDIGIYNDYLSYNGRYVRLFSTLEFSEEEIDSPLIPDGIDYVLLIKRNSKEKSLSRLERIRSGHLSSFMKSKRDLSSEGAYSQAENLLSDVLHGEEALFTIELYFLLKDYSLDGLNDKTRAFHSEMTSRGVKTFVEGQSLRSKKSGLAYLFNELIPGVKPSFSYRSLPNKTSHLRYLLPLSKSRLTDEGIRFHDIQDREIFLSVFKKKFKNRNMLVSGMSGTGKSVFVNKLIHYMAPYHPTVILDMGGSYKRLSIYHGGIELKKGFNPFHFKDPIYLREIILSVADSSKFDKLERGKLLAEIKEILPSCNNFFDLLRGLEKEFKGISFYFEEIKEFITDDPLRASRILYVDIENLPRGIVSPMIIYILEYFNNIDEKEKILVFDECWEYLQDHVYFVSKCFRTFRKTGAFPIAISQSLMDFKSKSNQLYTAITNNSYFNVLFPQEVERESGLSEFDEARIESLEFEKSIFSECYIKTKDNLIRKIIRNYLTALELEISHTESGEDELLLDFISNFNKYFSSPKQAIESFVRLKHENEDDFTFFTSING